MKAHYDIIVAGGGFAGVCAAVSAARMGKSVCLIEKHNCLGGAASYGLVLPFMYYWTCDPTSKERIPLSRGIFAEIVKELSALDGVRADWQECFNEEILKVVLNRLVINSGVTLLFQSYISHVSCQNGKISSVTVSHVGGKRELLGDYFIDATGDGNLCYMAGFDYMLGREEDGLCQPMTLSFRLSGVNIPLFEKTHHLINETYKSYKDKGKISNPRENILSFKTTHHGILHFNSTRVIKLDPTNIEELTQAEIIGREQAFELFTFLKSSFEAFKNATLLSTGMQIGVRESRRIVGEYVLTRDDIISQRKFHDSVAFCNYDIDIHNPSGEGTSHYYFKDGEYYSIPYRSLIPRGSVNLLVAGRCISATHEAQASLRIMPVCATLGQGAGVAAAIAHSDKLKVGDIDTDKLRNAIFEQGGIC